MESLHNGKDKENDLHSNVERVGQVFQTVPNDGRVVSKEMGFYCFDVLLSHLEKCEPPRNPSFPNDS